MITVRFDRVITIDGYQDGFKKKNHPCTVVDDKYIMSERNELVLSNLHIPGMECVEQLVEQANEMLAGPPVKPDGNRPNLLTAT